MARTRTQPSRRDILKLLGATFGTAAVGAAIPRISWGDASGREVFFVNIQASGGWDQALMADPKPDLRGPHLDRELYIYGTQVLGPDGLPAYGTGIVTNPTASLLRETPGGGIRYLGFADFHADSSNPAHPYQPLFPTYHDRILVFNGVDTGTNNHSVGERYMASGSLNEGYPCVCTQAALARDPERPLAFMNMGGYDETGGLLSATPVSDALLPNLLNAVNPNDISGDNSGTDAFLDPAVLSRVHAARGQSLNTLESTLRLPDQQRALAAVRTSLAGRDDLVRLQFSTNNLTTANLLRIGFEAFRQGLAVSMNVPSGGFDSHQDNEQQQVAALYQTFDLIKVLVSESENPTGGASPVPVVALISTDFGRTPFRTDGGTDHWPISTAFVVANQPAQALGLALPTNATIGYTTDGDELEALRPGRIDPVTLAPSDSGITLTPGHLHRVVRRLLGIDSSAALRKFPIDTDGDLAIG